MNVKAKNSKEFVVDFKKNFKYFNYNLNIPVKTSQEQKIVIPLVKNILFDDSTNTANVEYCDNK